MALARFFVLVAIATGCGRFHFDLHDDGGDGDGNGVGDGLGVDAKTMLTAVTYIKASNSGPGDIFGTTVAISADGNTFAVGAPFEASASPGINSNQADNNGAGNGAVYVFVRSGGSWVQQVYIKASNTDVGDSFGGSLALSADGNTLAVGAGGEASNATGIGGNQADNSLADAGAVYVFTRTGMTWTQEAYIKASNPNASDTFSSVSLSGDGNTLVVGAPGEASAAMGIGGNQLDNSKAAAGAAYVFTRIGTFWSQQAYVKASNPDLGDRFGTTVSLSTDGNTLAVGAPDEGSSATGVGGNQVDNSSFMSGGAYVFTRIGIVWSQQAYIKATNTDGNDWFALSGIALSGDGNTLAVGAPREDSSSTVIDSGQGNNSAVDAGAVYVYVRAGSIWTPRAYLKAPNTDPGDQFGASVALSSNGTSLLVGALSESSASSGIGGDPSDNSDNGAGAAYVYALVGATWVHRAYLKATNPDTTDVFGLAVAMSADAGTVVAGAGNEDSMSSGVGHDGTNNAAPQSGAAYIYE